jgi:DNA-binding XRE family transcriptional regulator
MTRSQLALAIRSHAAAAGYTTRTLATALGVTPQCVWSWYVGNSFPQIDTLIALCAACGVTLAEFFEPQSYRDMVLR